MGPLTLNSVITKAEAVKTQDSHLSFLFADEKLWAPNGEILCPCVCSRVVICGVQGIGVNVYTHGPLLLLGVLRDCLK